jgi:hypothetical protein
MLSNPYTSSCERNCVQAVLPTSYASSYGGVQAPQAVLQHSKPLKASECTATLNASAMRRAPATTAEALLKRYAAAPKVQGQQL